MNSWRLTLRQFIFCLMTSALVWPCAFAFEAGTGPGFITHGDNRMTPSVQSWMQTSFGLLAGITNSGEKNSAFSQQTALAHVSYATRLPGSQSLEANLGLGGIFSRTTLSKSGEAGTRASHISQAGGIAMGLRWKPALLGRKLKFRLSWDTLYVPPGLSVLYFTFGHAQSVSTGLGWDF